eukprot:2916184-Prymnesium_polylepis.1
MPGGWRTCTYQWFGAKEPYQPLFDIDEALVDTIGQGLVPQQSVDPWRQVENATLAAASSSALCAVKRIPRNLSDPMTQYALQWWATRPGRRVGVAR